MVSFFDVSHERRSVRNFFSYPVDDNLIHKIVIAGHEAPAAGNIVNWDLLVVQDKESRLKIASACDAQFWMSDAPVFIVVCSRTSDLERVYGSRGRLFAVQNSSAVIENMLLAAQELGLGSCWIGSFNERHVKELLSVPDKVDVHGIVVLGHTAVVPPAPKRDPVSNYLFFEKFGKKSKY